MIDIHAPYNEQTDESKNYIHTFITENEPVDELCNKEYCGMREGQPVYRYTRTVWMIDGVRVGCNIHYKHSAQSSACKAVAHTEFFVNGN